MQPSRQRFIAAMVLTAAGLLSAPVVNAQTQPPAAAPSGQTTNIPEQKLDAAAAAMEQVASLRKQYQQRIEEAPTADKETMSVTPARFSASMLAR